jgi:hypothetical protein
VRRYLDYAGAEADEGSLGEGLESLGSDHLRETVQRLAEATNNGCGGRLAELEVLRMLTGLARAGCLRHSRKSQCSRPPTRTGAWPPWTRGLVAGELDTSSRR